jgi:hypothetical protein
MRVIKESDVDWAPRNPNSHRGGHIDFKFLLTGEEGSPENYKLSLTKSDGQFMSPRHRHNFDQVRLPLEGRMSVHPDEWLEPGEVGYFPEGTDYGPQEDTAPFLAAVLQFGGASGSGYVSRRLARVAQDALATQGRFEGGTFRQETGEGLRIQDGYEAVWEYATGHQLVYPKPRYAHPIHMRYRNFAWKPSAIQGIWHKTLGVFTERETRLEMLKLEAGVQWTTIVDHALEVGFVLSGDGTCNDLSYSRFSAIECGNEERATYSCSNETILFRVVMPLLS